MHVFKIVFFFLISVNPTISQNLPLKKHILFYSSFDNGPTADYAKGDPLIYSAKSYEEANLAKSGIHLPNIIIAKNKGLHGNALHFTKQNTSAIYYNGYKNLGYNKTSWSGSFSFWLQVDPEREFAPGYCDPINLTDTKFNDAALWVDFTDDNPRAFRMGVLGDLEVWNPENKASKEELERRIVTVKESYFSSKKWTHIVLAYSGINTNNAVIKLYLDGQFKGVVKNVNDPYTWIEENSKIMLGLGYIGKIDELTVFDKPLELNEVKYIYKLKSGIHTLFE